MRYVIYAALCTVCGGLLAQGVHDVSGSGFLALGVFWCLLIVFAMLWFGPEQE